MTLPCDSSSNMHSPNNNNKTTNFMAGIMRTAIKAGFSSMHRDIVQHTKSSTSTLNAKKNETIQQKGMAVVCQQAAVDIVRSLQKLTHADQQKLKEQLGSPSSLCQLPNGNIFDAKTISSPGKHSHNNKLGEVTMDKTSKVEKGMKTAVDIDLEMIKQDQEDMVLQNPDPPTTITTTIPDNEFSLPKSNQSNQSKFNSTDNNNSCQIVKVNYNSPAAYCKTLVKKMFLRTIGHCRRSLKDCILKLCSDDHKFEKDSLIEIAKIEKD